MARLNPRRRRTFIAVHRFFGQVAAVVVLLLVVTGMLLNHIDDVAWMKGTVSSDLLLGWYGVVPTEEVVHYTVGRHSAASLEHGLYLDGRLVGSTHAPLLGAVLVQRFVAFAVHDRVIVFDPNPKLADDREPIVDQMDSASLPGRVVRVGLTPDRRLAVETPDGRFASNADLLGWEPYDAAGEVTWSESIPPSAEQHEAILRGYRGEGLPRTRVIADLHSGRIFGRFGPAAMDASAIALLVLVVTGLVGSGFGRRRGG